MSSWNKNAATKEREKFLRKQKNKKVVADTLKDNPKQMKFSDLEQGEAFFKRSNQ